MTGLSYGLRESLHTSGSPRLIPPTNRRRYGDKASETPLNRMLLDPTQVETRIASDLT
jgi:hypothetical protein